MVAISLNDTPEFPLQQRHPDTHAWVGVVRRFHCHVILRWNGADAGGTAIVFV